MQAVCLDTSVCFTFLSTKKPEVPKIKMMTYRGKAYGSVKAEADLK